MFVIIELLLASCAVLVLCMVWHYRYGVDQRKRQFFKDLPGPTGLFPFGNIIQIRAPHVILPTFLKWTQHYDGVFKISIGGIRYMVANDYKSLELVLSSTKAIPKAEDYENFHPWLGTGLLTSSGAKWHLRRKMLTPAFHFKILEEFVDVFERAGKILVRKLQAETSKSSVDIYPLVGLCTLDVICETAMGITVNAQIKEQSEYVTKIQEQCRIVVGKLFSVTRLFPLLYSLTLSYYRERAVLKILHKHTTDVIDSRRTGTQNESYSASDDASSATTETKDEPIGIKKKKAFLDLLLSIKVDGKPLSQEDIREEVDTFMFEGHDTTSSAVSFALFCLANHPDVQQKVFLEQTEIFGMDLKSAPVTYQSLQQMKYLEMAIKETLRLYPSVPYMARSTNADMELDGQIIPEGTNIAISTFTVHRHPKFYPNPDKFDPSRFENIDGSKPYIFIPFSAGPRNCIGQKFAMLELKSVISKVIRNFELHPAYPKHEVLLSAEAILKSANGIRISLKKKI